MTKKTLHLHFPPEQARAPLIYRLVKDFDLVVNILQARIEPNEHGRAVIELAGTRNDINRGVDYLRQQGVDIDTHAQEIKKHDERCIDCGACVGVCPSDAIETDADFCVRFDRDKCVLCQACVLACPYDAMELAI
ncbi:MAG TPA: 4Fe-4S dicluster domain-containing protein [Planctomycetes bacterium]|nr:4Fe-4S dicluster domain-containing protein [Planctomycetota bacterium]